MSHWDEGWQGLENSAEENRAALQRMLHSSHWLQIESFLKARSGSLHGLDAVELGCGRAVASATLARQGARVTLVDLSEAALDRACEFFANNGLARPACVVANVLSLPESLIGRFDLASSFGLAEHFSGEERSDIFRAHLATLRPAGCIAISVPNRLYLPAQAYKWLAEQMGTWPYGFERDFSPRELLRSGKLAGLRDCQIVGSELFYDLFTHTLLKLPAFFRQLAGNRKRGPVTATYGSNGRYTMTTHFKRAVWASPLDAVLGFTITLLGLKP